MTPSDDLTGAFALLLTGDGGARPVSLDDARPGDGLSWFHFPLESPGLSRWLEDRLGLPEPVRRLLLSGATHVQVEAIDPDGLVLLLRQPRTRAEPGVRTGLRVYATRHLCLTLADREVASITLLRHELEQGRGPRSTDFLLGLAGAAASSQVLHVVELDERMVDLEARVEAHGADAAQRLRDLRRALIELRSAVSASRDVLMRVGLLDIDWLRAQRRPMKDLTRRADSVLKDLDSLLDRARILHDELKARQDARMNYTLYVLTLISGVFLPLSFITGLLGVNVGGIPGTAWPGSFVVLCLLLLALAVAEWWALRRRKLV
ncbi:CorA family divalent cation transporter [Pyxidicoccus trucidator]|uniref:CorA family divalent cation transporter n=1 Tax=Pyxidicoccus trucidator TaxID=2709662 RepID=UPI0013D9DE14|nr:CorA family divalent cation transporter [Pyxidicoccus trucidator]